MIIYEAINLINNKRYIGQTIYELKIRKRNHLATAKRNPKVSMHFYSSLNKYGEENFEWKIIDVAKTRDELNAKESFWIEFFDTTNPDYGYNLKGGGYQPFLTDEVKEKIGTAQMGELNHMFGATGANNPFSKKVLFVDRNEIFESVMDLYNTYKDLSYSKVCAVCRGDRKTTGSYTFRYLDETGNIIDNGNEIKVRPKLINYETKEVFKRVGDAFKKYKKDGQDRSTLYFKLKKGNGICKWNDYIWYFDTININEVDLSKIGNTPIYNNKPVINLTTGEYFERIQDTMKSSCNLATKLRQNNGHCYFHNCEWKLVN